MRTRFVVAVIGTAIALTTVASASPAAKKAEAPSALSFVSVHALVPPHGGGSRAPHGYIPLHASALAHAKDAANSKAGLRAATRGAVASGTDPAVSSYPNVSPSFNGDYEAGMTPPDTTGAIGPDRYIETINTQYAIYSRSGALMNGGDLSSLTGIPTGLFGYSLSDPQMMWDAKTQRFYYSAVYYDSLFFSDNGIAVGWSKTATPSSAGDFCQYALGFGSEVPDYPKLGDSSDFLLFGYNKFGNAASTYDGSEFAALNKPPAGSTCASTTSFAAYTSGVLHNLDGSQAATPVPANLVDDANGAGYVVANADLSTTPSANFISVYSVTTSGTDANGIPIPTISGPTNISVPSYSMPASAPQQGSSSLLDTLDGRFEASVAAVDPAHGNKLAVWTAHAVFGGAGSEQRWYEIDPGAGSLLQSGVVSNPSLFIWNGAISPDRANTGSTGAFGDSMAMSVSTSSTTTDPAIQLVWKRGSDGQSPLTNLVQSGGPDVDFSCSPCRWGDYSGASPDPAATGTVGTVWLGNQYNVANGSTSSTAWRTWIFAVTPTSTAPPPAALSFAAGPQTITAGQPATMQLKLSAAQPSDVVATVSSNSPQGQFAANTGGTWSSTLPLTIAATQTTSPVFYYRDTKAGTPTLTASATGVTAATQSETVAPGPLASINVSAASASVPAGGQQAFTASGADQFQNLVGVSGAVWSTSVPGGSVSPTTGTSTTFTAGSTAGSGTVSASVGAVTGNASVTVTVPVGTPAPSHLVAVSLRRRRISLSWTGSGSGVTYNVYRGTSAGGESSTPYMSGLTTTTTTDRNVVVGTTYYYKVTALGPGGESGRSNEASATGK